MSLARDRVLDSRAEQADIKYRVYLYASRQVKLIGMWANNLQDIE